MALRSAPETPLPTQPARRNKPPAKRKQAPARPALRIRGPMSDLQRLTRWTDAIMDGRRTFGDVRRYVKRQKKNGNFEAWNDYEGPAVKGGDIKRLRLGADAIEDRIRQIYGNNGVSLGSELVAPKERKSIGQDPLSTRALVRIERAWDRAVDPYEQTPAERRKKQQQRKKAQKNKKRQNGAGGSKPDPMPKVVDGGSQPRVIRVQRGESLSSIAQRELGDADAWRRLYKANRKRVGDDPNVIQVGTRLVLPGGKGKKKKSGVKVRAKRRVS